MVQPSSRSIAMSPIPVAPVRESASAKESPGDSCLAAPDRTIPRKIKRLAAVALTLYDSAGCLRHSHDAISDMHASVAHGASPDASRKPNRNRGLTWSEADIGPPRIVETAPRGSGFPPAPLPL